MTKSKNTKRALWASVLSMLVCAAMLVGSTFAWFTDSVTSGKNKIVAGNLDVELEYKDSDGAWQKVLPTTDLFHPVDDTVTLWEPGHVEVTNLRISNVGTLALQYIFDISIAHEIGSINVDGNPFKLSDYIQFAVVDGDKTYSFDAEGRAQALVDAEAAGATFIANLPVDESGTLLPSDMEGSSKCITLIAYMPATVGNAANYRTGEVVPSIDMGVELFATQVPYESDSFDENYDADALVKADSAQALVDAIAGAQVNDIVMLSANIDAPLDLEIDKNITLFMNGKSLSTVNVTLSNNAVFTLANGKADAVKVNGAGTLELKNMRVTASEQGASAVALGDESNIAIAIKGTNILTGAEQGNGISVPAGAELKLSGDTLTTIGNKGEEIERVSMEGPFSLGGSGIRADGTLVIDGLNSLTALGYGVNGFGVGGSTDALEIKNTTVEYARGGYARTTAYAFDTDKKYIKFGGGKPSIGIDTVGTVTLEEVTVKKAEGGIKSAAIGGYFHHAVTVNISGCTINDVVGGASAAAIGGGRATNDVNDKVVIKISDTTIKNARGGDYGAGIGSGYDTNCSGKPSVDIQITNSNVTAKGGARAAGIGTGFHVGHLTGSIDSESVVVAIPPDEAFYKQEYTTAQSIGYGIVNLTGNEFKDEEVTFTVGGKVIDSPVANGN